MAVNKGMTVALLAACAACACTAGWTAADQVAPRMDRSKLLIGAYCFNKSAHDESHVPQHSTLHLGRQHASLIPIRYSSI